MAYFGRIAFTTATTGTGTVTVGSALTGYQTPAGASVANSSNLFYTIVDSAAWESGYGVYTVSGTTLSRNLIASSTGSLLSLSGNAIVYITRPAGPAVSVLTSSSGTYSTPTGATRLFIKMCGAGAGGAGSGTSPGLGTAGGNTTFGTSFLTTNGGAVNSSATASGAGGTASGGDINITGQVGSGSLSGYTNAQGGLAGSTPLGNGQQSAGSAAGIAGAGYGSGGGGAGSGGTASPGAGGSTGGYLEKWIVAPASSYAYTVGSGGTGGAAGTGTGAFAGGAGAPGVIIVWAFFD